MTPPLLLLLIAFCGLSAAQGNVTTTAPPNASTNCTVEGAVMGTSSNRMIVECFYTTNSLRGDLSEFVFEHYSTGAAPVAIATRLPGQASGSTVPGVVDNGTQPVRAEGTSMSTFGVVTVSKPAIEDFDSVRAYQCVLASDGAAATTAVDDAHFGMCYTMSSAAGAVATLGLLFAMLLVTRVLSQS